MPPRPVHTLAVDPLSPDPALIDQAVDALLDGGVIVYPTDTLYGLGCDATNPRAVARLCEVKGRPLTEPLPIIVHSREVLAHLVHELGETTDMLMNRFWPGGLTLILRRRGAVLSAIAPPGTLGVRIPDSPVALMLARRLHRPLVSTSANLTGRPAPAAAHELDLELARRIDLVLDAGPLPGGVPSTLLDLSGERAVILREGAVSRAQLIRYLPEIDA